MGSTSAAVDCLGVARKAKEDGDEEQAGVNETAHGMPLSYALGTASLGLI
jgi:hypothetical protein